MLSCLYEVKHIQQDDQGSECLCLKRKCLYFFFEPIFRASYFFINVGDLSFEKGDIVLECNTFVSRACFVLDVLLVVLGVFC